MKLVSTSSFERLRTEISQGLVKPGRNALGDSSTPEFALLAQDGNLNEEISNERRDEIELQQQGLLDQEPPVPNLEEIVATPVNGEKLVEGYRLFGSMFDALQAKLSLEASQELQGQVHDRTKKTDILFGFSTHADATETHHTGETKSVVIDLKEAKKWVKTAAKLQRSETDRLPSIHEFVGKDSTTNLQVRTTREMGGEANAADVHVTQVHPDYDLAQSEGATTPVEMKIGMGQPNPAQTSTHTPEIDQVVRAVMEQTDAFSSIKVAPSEFLARASQTGQTLRLSLHPAELGSVEVSVSKRGKRLHVTIIPELEGTARLLLRDVEKLVEKLGLSSSNSERVQVHIASQDGNIEGRGGDQNMQFSARSESDRDTRERHQATGQLTQVERQERDDVEKSKSIRRNHADNRSSDNSAVYI